MRTFAAAFVAVGTLGTFFAAGASAQIGHVVGAQKISDTSGGFTALLDDEDQFGRSIVNLGDLDGDGVSDLLVGAHTDDDGGIDQGAVYVLFMHPNGFVKGWQKISDVEGNFSGHLDPGDQFGRAAACVGDLDGDGVVDVVVSSNYDDDGGANKGAVYVLFLNANGTVKDSQKISVLSGGLPVGLKIHDEFGRSITALGDLDGDGAADIVVGTPQDDDGGTNTGALHVLFLNTNGTVKAYKRISRSTDGLRLRPGDWFGHCTANLGDFDGDGVNDLAVGAVLDDDGGVNQGSVWILLLNATGSVKASFEINELHGGFTAQLDDIDQFGTSVASLGDLDGDGVTDLAVGAVKDDDGGLPDNPDADVGAVYVLFLQADATVKSWVKIGDKSGDLPYELDQYDWFGSALGRIGGSPGDGLFNLAIGCRNDDDGNPNRGSIYLVQLNDGTAPAASFVASRTLGVAPLTVAFTDTSSGEVTAWLWNFGDGPQSNLQNPTKTYATPGVYEVRLTARGPRGRDTETRLGHITVVPGPLAAFSAAPSTGIAPLDVAFTDLSEGVVTNWAWNFGDGATASEPSPHHVFPIGTYTVTLTVTGPQGTHTATQTVTAVDLMPAAAFDATPRTGFAPLAVQYTDLSTGAVDARSWDFGDGATSDGASPLHTYTAPGVYTVALTASGPYGTDVETRADWIVVADAMPAAAFTAAPSSGFAPLSVAFTDLSTGNVTAWSWDLGDGTTASDADPVHVYDFAGTYTVTLTVSGPDGADSCSAAVVVSEPPPVAEFLAPSTAGFAPFTAQFTDQSSGLVTSRTWTFGDGASAGLPNPQHVYSAPGTYTVSLMVSGPTGFDSITRTALILVEDPAPVADLGAPQTSGVAPLVVQFADLSDGMVTSWWWEFGDGATSAERDPEHLYGVPGTYDVRLTVAGPAGTDSVMRGALVEVREPPPEAAFDATPTTGFAPLAVEFTDRSLGLVDGWAWDFGDGSTSTAASPAHVYATAGTYTVTLSVAGPGGGDVLTRTVAALDPAPFAGFDALATSGVAPLTVQFTDASAGLVTSWSWSFGDGATSTAASPQHVYTTPGTYTVSLTATGPQGSDVEQKVALIQVLWPAPTPEFVAGPVTGFAPLAVAFTDLSSGNATSWTWSFGDGSTSRQRFPVKVYNQTGAFTVTLTTKGPGGTRSISHGGFTVAPRPVFPDGGFEQQPSGAAPHAPWSVSAGAPVTVRSNASADTGWPREGARWLEIDATGSAAATPPSNPRGAGELPAGAVGATQTFLFQPLAPHLLFDAAFLLGDVEDSSTQNDFMSVDVTDGTSTWNLFHADTFTDFPLVSATHGFPLSAAERVHVDLRTLFPAATAGTPLVLHMSVGNGGDGANASKGYFDAFRLVPAATATVRNGTGRNALRYASGPPVLGGGWTIQVDTTGHANARAIQLVLAQRPASGTIKPTGELLTSGTKLLTRSWPAVPGLNVLTVVLPIDLNLLGLSAASQVTITGGRAEMTNACDLVLGL